MASNLLDHVAFATVDTDKSIELFAALGFKKQLYYKQKIDKFASLITKLESEHGEIVELVQPCADDSVVSRMLQNKQATIYHTAFKTADLAATLTQLKSLGAVIITEPMEIPYPATEAHKQYKTSHVFHPHVGLFEVTGP